MLFDMDSIIEIFVECPVSVWLISGVKPIINFFNIFLLNLCFLEPGYFNLSLTFLRPYIFWNVHDFSTFGENIKGCLKSCSEMPGYGKHLL